MECAASILASGRVVRDRPVGSQRRAFEAQMKRPLLPSRAFNADPNQRACGRRGEGAG